MPITQIQNQWILETQRTAYVFGVNDNGLLEHCYWGPRKAESAYPQCSSPQAWASFNGAEHMTREEYPTDYGLKYVDPCFKAVFADGVRDTVLVFVKAEINAAQIPELRIELKDIYYPIRINLSYRVHEPYDLIERWVEVENVGQEPVTLERVWSAEWHLPGETPYRMTHTIGRWMEEAQLRQTVLSEGIKSIESRRIATGHTHIPWAALDAGYAQEENGEVWFSTLAWSGSWKLSCEMTDFKSTRINIGLNDWDFAWCLSPGENFCTPHSFGGFTNKGFGGASRLLHDYVRDQVLPHGRTPHKVLYNSWEATAFDVDVESQGRLAEIAADMGIELFVMDDGWFHGRNNDTAGLGDWWPDETKFPNGLKPLIEKVESLGMEFGLWIEPEMVNPDSDLYRANPDWVIHYPTRRRSEGRNQLMLNFAREDVQDYILEKISELLAKNPIRFIKWDMNRNVSEPGWPDYPGDQREIWVRYVEGVYRVWGTLRERFPEVTWQSCSGGGGRADLGILRFADQVWPSDNTDPLARLNIQEGFSQIFPANVMEAWVTDMGAEDISLDFRFHVSMCGSLGVGGNLFKWSEATRAQAAARIAEYKAIREIVQLGDQYRLISPRAGQGAVVAYMTKDGQKGVLFVFNPLRGEHLKMDISLTGLAPDANYLVEGWTKQFKGSQLMTEGIRLSLDPVSSRILRFRRVA
jgi:alpha-galactosidase